MFSTFIFSNMFTMMHHNAFYLAVPKITNSRIIGQFTQLGFGVSRSTFGGSIPTETISKFLPPDEKRGCCAMIALDFLRACSQNAMMEWIENACDPIKQLIFGKRQYLLFHYHARYLREDLLFNETIPPYAQLPPHEIMDRLWHSPSPYLSPKIAHGIPTSGSSGLAAVGVAAIQTAFVHLRDLVKAIAQNREAYDQYSCIYITFDLLTKSSAPLCYGHAISIYVNRESSRAGAPGPAASSSSAGVPLSSRHTISFMDPNAGVFSIGVDSLVEFLNTYFNVFYSDFNPSRFRFFCMQQFWKEGPPRNGDPGALESALYTSEYNRSLDAVLADLRAYSISKVIEDMRQKRLEKALLAKKLADPLSREDSSPVCLSSPSAAGPSYESEEPLPEIDDESDFIGLDEDPREEQERYLRIFTMPDWFQPRPNLFQAIEADDDFEDLAPRRFERGRAQSLDRGRSRMTLAELEELHKNKRRKSRGR